MAEPNTNDVRTATNASNSTRYFHLPLFISTDKPSWLVDWNGAMGDLDNILQDIATASESAVADVATIQTQIDAINQIIPTLQSLVDEAVSDVASMQTTVDSHETRMDAIETDLITQNNLIKTLSDAVTAMQATVATLNNRVQAMETTVSGLDTDVSAISTELSTIRTQMTTISGQISSLDSRVTALEQAQPGGGGGMPVLSDLNFTSVRAYGRNDISAATMTVHTAQRDEFVIIRSSMYGDFRDASSAGLLQPCPYEKFSIGSTAFANHSLVIYFDQNVSSYASEIYTPMIRLKAGDSITLNTTILDHSAANCSTNIEIFTAPVQ